MDEVYSRIITEIELHNQNPNNTQTPLPHSTLSDIQSLFDNALDSFDTEDIDRLWEEFALRNLSPSSIITPLTATMDFAHTHLSLFAAQLYLSLLLSPNSPVFTLFTPIAFVSFLASLRRSFKQNKPPQLPESGPPGPQKKKRGGARGGQGGVRGGRGKRGKSLFPEDEEMTGEETAAAEGANSAPFDVRDLFPVLEKLENVLSLIHLDRFPDSLKSLINTITALPITALEHCEHLGSYNQLSDRCFRILKGVLKPEHGDVTNTSVEVLKSLSPSILLLKSQAKTSAMKFVTHQMMRMGKENEAVRKALVYHPRYLANKAPERSDPRAAAVESILEIVRAMELEDQIGFVDYVVKMTQGKSNLRLLAVDIIPALLMSLPDPLSVDGEDAVVGKDWWGLRCLGALISRCADAGAVTRARAISNLAQVVDVLSGDLRNRERLKEIMGFASTESEHLEGRLNELLRKRCTDEKAMVRKASLLLITKSTALLDKSIDGVLLKTMGIACSDPLLSIRKAAISALSEVFRRFSDENVIIEWLHSVPQLITDNESSIQEECENLFLELVLNRLSRVGSMDSVRRTTLCSGSASKIKNLEREMESAFPEGVLILLKGICEADVTPCLKKICTSLGKKKRLKPSIAFALQNIIRTSESIWLAHSMPIGKWTAPPGAWLLLSEVSIFLPKAVGWEFLHHHWQLLDKSEVDNEIQSPFTQNNMDIDVEDVEANSASWARDRVFLLQTISNVSVELPPEPAAELASKLLTRIEEFNMHTTEVNAHVKALRTLCKRQALKPEEGDQLVLKWVTQLVSKGLGILQTYISEALQVRKANDFRTPPRSVVRKGKKTAASSKMLLQAVTAVYTVGSLVIVCPSLELNDIVEVLQTIITSGKTGMQLKKLPNITVSIEQLAPSLYIHSWVTMGKICLANDKLAKRYIPLFVKELETNESAALRNNIVLMMADFCVRYTALVDCYISKITNCLRDPCEVVRRQTFILLSRLLQRDYVKWRGVLFLRFLLCLVDESEKIRQLADFLFGNILRAKAPLLAYNSFVEAIFVLNDCHAHAGHSESQGSRAESRLFSIRGNDEKSRTQRMHIYVSLLKQMAPEHLLATSAKLCAEILAAASDGLLNLDDVTGQTVLQDALQILACKEIRIQSNRGAATDSTEMDEEAGDSGGADAAAAAKRRVVAQVAKKSLIQNALPIFIELKRLLESKNSPLTGCLMECLRNLLKDYKNEFDDILVADKQLQKELMYDMEKYEALKTKSTVAEAVATVQRANVYASPPGRASVVSKIVTDTVVQGRLAQQLASPEQVASVMADVAAEKTVKSVLKDVNRNGAASPLLGSMSRAKLKSALGGPSCRENLRPGVLESLTKRHNFDSMDIN